MLPKITNLISFQRFVLELALILDFGQVWKMYMFVLTILCTIMDSRIVQKDPVLSMGYLSIFGA